MADPKKTETKPSPEASELDAARARIADLERELDARARTHQNELDAASSVLQSAHRELDAARVRIAELEAATVHAPGSPAARGQVVVLRALRGLRFTLRGTPTRLAAGRTVEATPEDLIDDGLVEGEDFEVVAR